MDKENDWGIKNSHDNYFSVHPKEGYSTNQTTKLEINLRCEKNEKYKLLNSKDRTSAFFSTKWIFRSYSDCSVLSRPGGRNNGGGGGKSQSSRENYG
jgi:hypothetical protein